MILSLLGGLALFLYGMHMMSTGLESAAGDRMKTILEKLTSNPILGVVVGALITAVIQSSSATTVMVVGFVNSQLMTLQQAVWIIMGANIGTTITGQLVALNASEIAPVLAIIGVIMVTFLKNKKVNAIGEILAGLGILFIGMGTMSSAMEPLRESPIFLDLITTISNPVLAILVGAGFTALIQSSSASVGILQALALSGLIPLSSSIYIIFGQNIGTCITSALASLNANRNAKRTTIIHLSFNIIGTILFMIFTSITPFVDFMVSITDNPAAQIANTHTIFKLARLAEIILPIKEEELDKDKFDVPLTFIDMDNIGSVPIAISSLRKEALATLHLAQANINESIEALYGHPYNAEKIMKREKRINFINYEITNYMTMVSQLHMNDRDSITCNALYKCFADIERIGDHAINILKYTKDEATKLKSSEPVQAELEKLNELLSMNFSLLLNYGMDNEEDSFTKFEHIEQRIDELTANYRDAQIKRLKEKQVDAKDTVFYSAIMSDIERVGDHLMNIIEEFKRCSFTLIEEQA